MEFDNEKKNALEKAVIEIKKGKSISEIKVGNTVDNSLSEDAIRSIVKETMAESTVDEKTIKAIVSKVAAEQLSTYKKLEVKVGEAKPKKMKGILPEEFETILQLAAARKNVLLVGPSGCGKTFIVGKVAEALSLNYASQSCSAGMSESMLAGWLIPVGSGGKFVYVSSEFVKAYEKGGVFLLDEIDAADPNTMVFFNQALAQDHFFLPQRHEKPKITKHKNFICIAAANTFGNGSDMMFVGRNQLDAATLDRFRIGMVMMDYSPVVEKALIDPEVLEWGLDIRSKINAHRLRKVMSTRFMLDCTDMLKIQGWKKDQWERTYFADWSVDEKRKVQTGRSY